MNDKFIINVADVIGSDLCITPEDGQKIYDIIISILEEPKQIEISFEFDFRTENNKGMFIWVRFSNSMRL